MKIIKLIILIFIIVLLTQCKKKEFPKTIYEGVFMTEMYMELTLIDSNRYFAGIGQLTIDSYLIGEYKKNGDTISFISSYCTDSITSLAGKRLVVYNDSCAEMLFPNSENLPR
jgi:hypothetical protein